MASPFLAGFPGGLMEGQQFAQQQELRRLQLQQALQEQQTLGAIGQTLRQNPQLSLGGFSGGPPGGFPQPTGYQAGVGQDIATTLAGGPPQDGGTAVDAGLPQVPNYGPSGGMGQAPPRLPGLTGGVYNENQTSGLINQLAVARNLMQSGYPPAAAAGIVGSMTGESGQNLDPYSLNPQSGAVGMANWLGPRKEALLRQPNPYSPSTQVNFLKSELAGPESATGQRMMLETDPRQAARDFTTGFERPGNVPMGGREQAALAVYRQLDGEVGQKGIKLIQAGMPAPAVQASTQTAQAAGRLINPQQWGRSQLPDIFAAVDKANPGAPDAVKVLAAMQLNKIAAPEERMALQIWARENSQAIQIGLKQMQIDAANARAAQAQFAASQRQERGIEAAGERQERGIQAAGERQPAAVALNRYLEEHPDATAEEIQSFIQRGRSARSGPAMAAQKYLQEHPDASAEEIRNFVAQTAAQVSTVRQFDVGTQGNIVRSINVAVDHLAVLQDAGKGLENTPIQWVNRIANEWAKQTGQPAPTNFDAVKAIVKDELVKAVLGGVGALGDRQEVESTIDRQSSPEQLMGVIRRYEQLMGGQMRGLRQQFTSSGGGDEAAFDQKLFPRTREALRRAGAPAEEGTTPGASQAAVGQVPTVTKEQYDALPTGAPYKMPGDPNTYKKPAQP